MDFQGKNTKYFLVPLLFLSLGALFFAVFVSDARAGASDNVSGWAWSENVGWISFNCTNDSTCGTVNYGVNVRQDDYLEGYAWTETVGWISFNLADTVSPPAQYNYSGQGFLAQLQGGTNQLRGWMKALATDPTWDGWMKLYKHPSDGGPDYGVTLNESTGELEGWAWGGDVFGWISFNCLNQGSCGTSNYAVHANVNTAPTVSNLVVSLGNYCTTPAQQFSWVFSDVEDGASQGGYWLQVQPSSAGAFPGSDSCPQCAFNSGKQFPNGAQSSFVNVSVSPGVNQLGFNTGYRWRVKVYDSSDLSSAWIEGSSFTTPLHPYPDLSTRFIWAPTSPSTGELVLFSDNVVFSGTPSWLWTFQNGLPPTSTVEDPVMEFESEGPKTVTLKATDLQLEADPNSGSGACQDSQTVNAGLPLPGFKEVGPSSFWHSLQKLFGFMIYDLRFNGII